MYLVNFLRIKCTCNLFSEEVKTNLTVACHGKRKNIYGNDIQCMHIYILQIA